MLQNILENAKHWMDPSYIVGEATDTGHWTDADYVDETARRCPTGATSSSTPAPSAGVCEGVRRQRGEPRRVAALAQVCEEKASALVYVMPPVDGAIREYVFDGLALWDDLAYIKQTLAATARACWILNTSRP